MSKLLEAAQKRADGDWNAGKCALIIEDIFWEDEGIDELTECAKLLSRYHQIFLNFQKGSWDLPEEKRDALLAGISDKVCILTFNAIIFSSPDLKDIASLVDQLPNLKKLNLVNNNLNDEDLKKIVETIKSHQKLININISDNLITPAAVKEQLLPFLAQDLQLFECKYFTKENKDYEDHLENEKNIIQERINFYTRRNLTLAQFNFKQTSEYNYISGKTINLPLIINDVFLMQANAIQYLFSKTKAYFDINLNFEKFELIEQDVEFFQELFTSFCLGIKNTNRVGVLSLASLCITEKMMRELAESLLNNKGIYSLVFEKCTFEDQALPHLANLLETSRTINDFCISSSNLASFSSLTNAIAKNNKLTSLKLNNNIIKNALEKHSFLALLSKNSHLASIDISDNQFPESITFFREIISSLQDNLTLNKFTLIADKNSKSFQCQELINYYLSRNTGLQQFMLRKRNESSSTPETASVECSNNYFMDGATLRYLCSQCPSIYSLIFDFRSWTQWESNSPNPHQAYINFAVYRKALYFPHRENENVLRVFSKFSNYLINLFKSFTQFLAETDQISELKLVGLPLTEEYLDILLPKLRENKSIAKLSLISCSIDDAGAEKIGDWLKKNKTVLSLKLVDNNISKVKRICNALETSISLNHFDLSQNPIGKDQLLILGTTLLNNKSLTEFNLGHVASRNGVSYDFIPAADIELFIKKLDPAQDTNLKGNAKKNALKNTRLIGLNINSRDVKAKFYGMVTKLESKNKEFKGRLYNAVLGKDRRQFDEARKQASIFMINDDGDTLLHIAAGENAEDILRILLNEGLNPHVRNKKHQTAADIARDKGHEEIAHLLEGKKPDPKLSDTPKFTLKGNKVPPTLPSPAKPVSAQKRLYSEVQDRGSSSSSSSTEVVSPPPKKQKTSHPPISEVSGVEVVPSLRILPHVSQLPDDAYPELISEWVATGNLYRLQQGSEERLKEAHDATGNTLLHIAMHHNQRACLEYLLNKNVPIDEENNLKLSALAEGIEQLLAIKNAEARKIKLGLIWLLIRKGANVNYSSSEHSSFQGATPLHIAVACGDYRLMKLILASPSCDPNNKGLWRETPLDLIVEKNNVQLLARLLIDRRLEALTIRQALDRARKNDSQQMIAMLQSKLNAFDAAVPTGVNWVKSLSVVWGSAYASSRPSLAINSDEHHAFLAMNNKILKPRLPSLIGDWEEKKKAKKNDEKGKGEYKASEDEVGNPVTASVSFILSATPYLRNQHSARIEINIPLNFIKNYHVSDTEAANENEVSPREELERIIHRVNSASFFHKDEGSSSSSRTALNIEEIKQKAAENLDIFNRLFHHGEQGLLDYSEQDLTADKLIQKLLQHPNFVKGSKLYGLILKIHSPRYLCENCEESILGEQNSEQSIFLKNISTRFVAAGGVLPEFNVIRMLTQISSYIPHNSDQVSYAQHQDFILDLRACGNAIILAKDMAVSEAIEFTSFDSRYDP